jgi:hypothetical protein
MDARHARTREYGFWVVAGFNFVFVCIGFEVLVYTVAELGRERLQLPTLAALSQMALTAALVLRHGANNWSMSMIGLTAVFVHLPFIAAKGGDMAVFYCGVWGMMTLAIALALILRRSSTAS